MYVCIKRLLLNISLYVKEKCIPMFIITIIITFSNVKFIFELGI